VSKLAGDGAEAVVRFHTWLRAADRSASTVRVYGTVAAEFVAFAGTTVGWHIATPGTPKGPTFISCTAPHPARPSHNSLT